MTGRRVGVCLSGVVLACCLAYDVWSLAQRVEARANETFQASWRDAGRMASGGESVAVLVKDEGSLRPSERTRLLAVNWELLPRVARPRSLSNLDGALEDVVMASSFAGTKTERCLVACGFRKEAGNDAACIWRRRDASHVTEATQPLGTPRWWRELFGVGVVCSLIVCAFIVLTRWEGAWSVRETLLAGVVFCVLAGVTLTNGFLAPNGLGVYGGKAKLLYCSGGIPRGFWTSPEYALYQQSYPPGLTAFALLVDILSGGCGDWLVQLLGPCAMALLATAIAGRRPSWLMMFAVLSFVFSPWSAWMASEFYAEPFAALCLVCGWRRAWTRGGGTGWLVVGCAGLFRHEGIVAAALLWVVSRIFGASERARWSGLLYAIGLSLVWQIFRMAVAARVPDYDFMDFPDARNFIVMAKMAIGSTICLWNAGGAALVPVAVMIRGRRRAVCAAGAVAVAFLAAMCWLLACNKTPHVDWLAANCAPRLVWIALAVVFASATLSATPDMKQGECVHQGKMV